VNALFGKLPVNSRCAVLESVGGAPKVEGGTEDEADPSRAIVRSLAESQSDDEFLDLLAGVLTVAGKGGQRLRKIFAVIASERNESGSLLAHARGRLNESLRTKNYFAQKSWEAVERLLLERSEDAYLGRDHSRLLEELSLDERPLDPPPGGAFAADPAILADFEEGTLRRKATEVLLELLDKERDDADFLDLLEEVRKGIPNLISRKEFPLLWSILGTLTSMDVTASAPRRSAVQGVIGEIDFAHTLDLYLTTSVSAEDKKRIEDTIVLFTELSIDAFLDRLLMETDQSNRRALLSLAFRFGPDALPAIRARLSDSHWYFVRNLCLILGEIGDPGAAGDLVGLLEHKDYRVRREAIQALGKVRAVEATSSLGKILLRETLLGAAKEEALQIEAANALFRCGGTRGAAYLHRGAEACRARVRAHCAALLRTMEVQR
jgi:HEAT repeats